MGDSGFKLVVSSAAESVITLNIEPGSNGTDTPRSKRLADPRAAEAGSGSG
jgi:hypothetical protein